MSTRLRLGGATIGAKRVAPVHESGHTHKAGTTGRAKMKSLLLHIGTAKTGTTYFQEMLRKSEPELRNSGLTYPIKPESFSGPFPSMDSGNGRGLLSMHYPDTRIWLSLFENSPEISPIFSSEFLFQEIYNNPNLLQNLRPFLDHGCTEIRVLLVLRDPISYASSFWQQAVKQTGYQGDIQAFLQEFDIYERAERVVEKLSVIEGITLTILNHSRIGTGLSDRLSEWLGIKSSLLNWPDALSNESLGAFEVEFQLALNRAFAGRLSLFKGRGVAESALIPRSPSLQKERGVPPLEAQKAYLDRVRPSIERLNKIISSDHRIDMRPVDGNWYFGEHKYSQDDMEAVIRLMGEEILRARDTQMP